MNEKEYDGPGAAAMVGNVLMKSLYLTKDEVGDQFKQWTYDGVYAEKDKRVAGGLISTQDN